MVARIKKVYPGWVLRIYHDRSIRLEKKCELECLKDPESGQLYDNVDFCDVESIPRIESSIEESTWNRSQGLNISQLFTGSWNASDHVHSSMWRYMAIGDLFADVFVSRDLDMEIFPREVAAVNEWLASPFAGHIMRGFYWTLLNNRTRCFFFLEGMLIKLDSRQS